MGSAPTSASCGVVSAVVGVGRVVDDSASARSLATVCFLVACLRVFFQGAILSLTQGCLGRASSCLVKIRVETWCCSIEDIYIQYVSSVCLTSTTSPTAGIHFCFHFGQSRRVQFDETPKVHLLFGSSVQFGSAQIRPDALRRVRPILIFDNP